VVTVRLSPEIEYVNFSVSSSKINLNLFPSVLHVKLSDSVLVVPSKVSLETSVPERFSLKVTVSLMLGRIDQINVRIGVLFYRGSSSKSNPNIPFANTSLVI
jgi:hypothetical protein